MTSPVLIALKLGFGGAILFIGADWLIRGSSATARWLGLQPLVIGLTVIAYGTSAPELAVATKAALGHQQPIALGTVIGSCIANIALVLGMTALISPPTIDQRIIRREVPLLLGSVIALPLCLRDGMIDRVEGAVLVACAVLFTIVTLTFSARTNEPADSADGQLDQRQNHRPSLRFMFLAVPMMGLGVALLIVGADLFVRGAKDIGFAFQISDRMLGLTVVALGTAMPELIASIIAAARKQSGLAVGAVIGSNLMNVFLVLGVCAYFTPIRIGYRAHMIDFIALIIVTAIGIYTLRGARKLRRVEGAVLVLAYIAFLIGTATL